MIINLSKEDKKKLQQLLQVKEDNILAADMLNTFFCYEDNLPKQDYLDVILDSLELDRNNLENIAFFNKHLRNTYKEIDRNLVIDNPYYKNIKIKPVKYKTYELGFDKYYPYQGFAYDDIQTEENDYNEVSKVGYFKQEISFPMIANNSEIWMTTSPNEILTMEKDINDCFGDVLTFGLGLGYFAYMASIKSEVSSVTIIEKDPNIIALFKKNILPYFSHPEKIKIIECDAFEYIKEKHYFDYTFVDIYHNAEDGLPMYINFKNHENNLRNARYWLENSILSLLRRCLLTVMEETLNGNNDNLYLLAENDIDNVINNLYFKTKNLVINNYSEIYNLLKDESLIKLIKD